MVSKIYSGMVRPDKSGVTKGKTYGGTLQREKATEKLLKQKVAKRQAEEQEKRAEEAKRISEAKEEEKIEQEEIHEKAETERIAGEKAAYEEEVLKLEKEAYTEYLADIEKLKTEEAIKLTTFTTEEDARIKALENQDYEQWKEAKALAEKKDELRYDGDLGTLKFTRGRLDSGQDLAGYNIEYHEDGVTPKRIKGSLTQYNYKKYGPTYTKRDYYKDEWEFYPDGSIKQYNENYDYKASRGKAGNTSYYQRDVDHKKMLKFADDDGILNEERKYEKTRRDKDYWSNENTYSATFSNGIKADETLKIWSDSHRNWTDVIHKDLLTGREEVETGFDSYKPVTDPTEGLTYKSERMIYKPHPTQPGGIIPDIGIVTYEDGTIKIVDKNTGKKSYYKTKSGKSMDAGKVAIPELGILSYKTQIEQDLIDTGTIRKYISPEYQKKAYTSTLVLPEFDWKSKTTFVDDTKKFEYVPTIKDPFKYIETEDKDVKKTIYLKEGEMFTSAGNVVDKIKYLAEQARAKREKELRAKMPQAIRSKMVIGDDGKQSEVVTYRGYVAKRWYDPVAQRFKTTDPKLEDEHTLLVKRDLAEGKLGGLVRETQADVKTIRYLPTGEKKIYGYTTRGTPEQVYLTSMLGKEQHYITSAKDKGQAISDYLSTQFIAGQEARHTKMGEPRITRRGYAEKVLKESGYEPYSGLKVGEALPERYDIWGKKKYVPDPMGLLEERQKSRTFKEKMFPQTYIQPPPPPPPPPPSGIGGETQFQIPQFGGQVFKEKDFEEKQIGHIPMSGLFGRWKGQIGGQNIGNKIKDYAGEFKKKSLTKATSMLGKI